MKQIYFGIIVLIGGFIFYPSYGYSADLEPTKTTNYYPANHQSQDPPVHYKKGSVTANLSRLNIAAQNIPQQLNQWLSLESQYSFKKVSEKTDELHYTHEAYQQYYLNIPVEDNVLLIHSKNGKATYLNGKFKKIARINNQIQLSSQEALNSVKEAYGVRKLIETESPEKTIIFALENGEEVAKITYKIKAISHQPFLFKQVYVDAQTGEIIRAFDLIKTEGVIEGEGNSLYNGTVPLNIMEQEDSYVLQDEVNNIMTYDAREAYLTGISISGVHDIESPETYFNGIQMGDFNIQQIDLGTLDNDAQIYIQLSNAEDDVLYTSPLLQSTDLPYNLTNVNIKHYNKDAAYKLEILGKDTENDTLLHSVSLGFDEGNQDLNDENDFVIGSFTNTEIGNPAVDAHWGMEKVHQFYDEVFDRKSYDGNNSIIKQYLNPPNDFLGDDIGMPNNAFALEEPYNIMVYGMGDGQMFNPLVALDVAGHEFTHLVVSKNGHGGLNYMGEPGALNESFADIFGTAIEHFSVEDPDWLIGADIAVNGGALRSMSNPKAGSQPDTYEGSNWIDPDMFYYDNGGVHINSGVQNHWFYILSEGKSGTNDNGDSYQVEGLGIEKATKIAYQNLMNYLNASATFQDAYIGAMEASKVLYDLPSEEYTQNAKAWYAVGLADNPEEFCSGVAVFTDAQGQISDGSEDDDYANNTHCGWLIQPEGADKVVLQILALNTEKDADMVVIYDGADNTAPILGEFSGNELPEGVIESTGSSVFVEFYTDQDAKGMSTAETSAGWTIKYGANELGMEKNEIKNGINIFPNPAKDVFNIQSNLPEDVSMDIFDINGKRILSNLKVANGQNNFNIENLNSGVYLLKFQSNHQKHTEKLIVK